MRACNAFFHTIQSNLKEKKHHEFYSFETLKDKDKEGIYDFGYS